MEKAERIVVETIQRDGHLNSFDFKGYIDSTRKFALAILDYFDSRHIPRRFGNERRLPPACIRRSKQSDGESGRGE